MSRSIRYNSIFLSLCVTLSMQRVPLRADAQPEHSCCTARIASCLACTAKMTVNEYCRTHSTMTSPISGCPTQIGCSNCQKYDDGCNVCNCQKDGTAICTERYCLTTGIPRCLDDVKVCCKAMTATCLSCAEGMSVKDYCQKNPLIAGCERKGHECSGLSQPLVDSNGRKINNCRKCPEGSICDVKHSVCCPIHPDPCMTCESTYEGDYVCMSLSCSPCENGYVEVNASQRATTCCPECRTKPPKPPIVSCQHVKCARRPECRYEKFDELDSNGCPRWPCGIEVCPPSRSPVSPPFQPCPIPTCFQRPGCRYEKSNEVSSNGCPRWPCGVEVCVDCPLVKCVKKTTCTYTKSNTYDKNGCPKWPCGIESCTLSPLHTRRRCCEAMTAQCLSCANGLTVAEFCSHAPSVQGCPHHVLVDDFRASSLIAGFLGFVGILIVVIYLRVFFFKKTKKGIPPTPQKKQPKRTYIDHGDMSEHRDLLKPSVVIHRPSNSLLNSSETRAHKVPNAVVL